MRNVIIAKKFLGASLEIILKNMKVMIKSKELLKNFKTTK